MGIDPAISAIVLDNRLPDAVVAWGRCPESAASAAYWPCIQIGRQLDSFEADLQIPSIGDEPLHAIFIRAPGVTDVGPRAEVLARDPDGWPVAVRQGRVLATAFHPELTGDRRLHRLLAEMVAERVGRSG